MHARSVLFINTLGNTSYQRIYSLGADYGEVRNAYFQGSPSNPYVPGSPVLGQLIGTLPGGL